MIADEFIRVVDQDNGVPHHDARQADDSHKCRQAKIVACHIQAKYGTQQTEGNGQYYYEYFFQSLELEQKNQEY
ncbi:hypothetical protein SDC9_92531 [bioreactor metagenome]|uniref:Uncharacterized protein n=1 Tax=bioreactor metagenome TaxID=1076179 RepID=A0A644ZXZ7_9ZZZZ